MTNSTITTPQQLSTNYHHHTSNEGRSEEGGEETHYGDVKQNTTTTNDRDFHSINSNSNREQERQLVFQFEQTTKNDDEERDTTGSNCCCCGGSTTISGSGNNRRKDESFMSCCSSSCCSCFNYYKKNVERSRGRKIVMYSFCVFLLIAVVAAIAVPCALSLLGNEPNTNPSPINEPNTNPSPINEPNTNPSPSNEPNTNPSPIRVGAFNIRQFGKSLMRKPEVVSGLVAIFQRYDIVLVQEVRDSKHTALEEFKTNLNRTGEDWDYVASEPLGRSRYYKEQYVYFYKTRSVKILSSYQVEDESRDVYEREPFAVDVEYSSWSHRNRKQHVVLLGLHAKPDDVKKELRELSKTVKSVASKFPDSQGVIAFGDFNADCGYLSFKARKKLDVFSHPDFDSFISDDADTTVSKNTDCAYDRVVVYNTNMHSGGSRGVDVRDGAVFNYEAFLNIENEDAAGDISDHYPVEFTLN